VALGCLVGFGIAEAIGAIGLHLVRNEGEPGLPAALERYLNAHRERIPAREAKSVEVLDGAVPGCVAGQETLAYAIHHSKLDSRSIVALDAANEGYAAIGEQTHEQCGA